MTKGQLAKSNFESGMNCAQAVVLAFQNEMGLDELTLKKLIIGFGGGFGRQRLVCGAVCGMTLVLSYLKSDGNDKLGIYAVIQKACQEVSDKIGSIICSQLMNSNKTPCADICQIVADITDKYLSL